MPNRKVRWYDADKGFSSITELDGVEAFLYASALPSGITEPKAGARVEYSMMDGKHGTQAMSVTVLEKVPSLVEA